MNTFVTLDVIAIIPLIFTINLAKRHIAQNRKNKYYIFAAAITIALLIFEIASIFIASLNDPGLFWLNRLVNILGFSSSPMVPYAIFAFIGNGTEKCLHRALLIIPICLNILISCLSYKTGWVFFVDPQNQYIRGNLFILPTVISAFYYLLIIIRTYRNRVEYDRTYTRFLITMILLPVLATAIQILNPELLLIWACTSLSILMYYVISLELYFEYDIQTGVKNRAAFEIEMQLYADKKIDATIFVFDINNLKTTNDTLGHKVGDEMIRTAANIIKYCFEDVGKTFRIGGDEFCVICKDIPIQLAEDRLINLDNVLIKENHTHQSKIELAHGFASYGHEGNESIYIVFSQADNAMYTHKVQLKGFVEEEPPIGRVR